MRRTRWLPLVAFVVVLLGHLAWQSRGAPTGCITDAQGNSVPMASEAPAVLCPSTAGFSEYLADGDYFITLSYALAAAFTVYALGRWRSTRVGSVAGAVTGLSLGGFVAAFGCFVVGCCGSPMLPLWISLFGARGVGLAKPIVLGLTVASLAITLLLLRRKCGRGCCGAAAQCA